MKGLELAERFFVEQVSPVIDERCPALKDRYAAGLIGYGSDVLGYDDEISRDHEWGPRCILWLDGGDYRRYASVLDAALDEQLPAEFLGFPARFKREPDRGLVPCGPGEKGVHDVRLTTVARYLKFQFGLSRLPPSQRAWLCIPEQKLLEFTRGKVFCDPLGRITRAREILAYLPEDMWRFKLLYAWQSLCWDLDVVGLCALRGDVVSARLALYRTAERIIRLVFLLNRRYCPGTLKWLSRELGSLPKIAPQVVGLLEWCLAMPDPGKARAGIEQVIRTLMQEHNQQGITCKVELRKPDLSARGQVRFSLSHIVEALRETLPPALRDLKIQGTCDQWLTNDDILLCAKKFTRFRDVYKPKTIK